MVTEESCKCTYTDKSIVTRDDKSQYTTEHVEAEIKGRYLSVHIGGDDFYADGGRIPINFCPNCGQKAVGKLDEGDSMDGWNLSEALQVKFKEVERRG